MVPDLTLCQWIALLFAGFASGFSKSSGSGLGILLMPLVAEAYPPDQTIGILFPLFLLAGTGAVWQYHHYARLDFCRALLVWTLFGLFLGAQIVNRSTEDELRALIGAMILAVLLLNLFRYHYGALLARATIRPILLLVSGILIGISSFIANIGSPIMIAYLLTQDLSKYAFVGTLASFFFVVNLIKFPLNVHLGVVTWQTLQITLFAIPFIPIGNWAGIYFVRWISTTRFRQIVQIIAALGAFRLIMKSLT